MSAVKLEKKLASLERKLRDDLSQSLEPVLERIERLEELLRRGAADAQGVELPLPGATGDLVQVLPVQEAKVDTTWEEKEKEVEVEDLNEEPIPFADTVWNLTLVLGHSGAGWVDVFIACFVAFLGIFMQTVFIIVIQSEFFLPEALQEQVEPAKKWRAASAHDVKHMDLALTSLVSRVCNGDGSLILSTGQAGLIDEINQYMGLGNAVEAGEPLPPGLLLCTFCMMLWCVVLCGELRSIAVSIAAAAQIPRGRRTVLSNGCFHSISYTRFAMYLLVRLARTAVAVSLLFAGTQWLARTTSITDLILNAVALEAILQIDEIVFVSLFPKKVQVAIYELESVKLRYGRRSGPLESGALLILFFLVVLLPFFGWVKPLGDTMLELKKVYCEGNQTFVVSLNQDMQMYMGFATVEPEESSDDLLGQLAVMRHSSQDLVNKSAVYISFSETLDNFEQSRGKSMKVAAQEYPFCLDFDAISQDMDLASSYGAHFRAAAYRQGVPNATSCSQLAFGCDLLSSRLLRLVCPVTCGCAHPKTLPWFKVPSQGCPSVCRAQAQTVAAELPCTDAPTQENWDSFWDLYPTVMSSYIETDLLQTPEGPMILMLIDMMKSLRCVGLSLIGSLEPITSSVWCEGSERFFAPLALICPETCGCLKALGSHCPQSCNACADEVLPAASPVATCAEAKALGICSTPDGQAYCPETCGSCNGTVVAPCVDGTLPPGEFGGITNCSELQATGWCPMLVALNAPVSRLCGKSCGTCT